MWIKTTTIWRGCAWLLSATFCGIAIIYFYGLKPSAELSDLFQTYRQQYIAVLYTTSGAMLISTWTCFLNPSVFRNPLRYALAGAVGIDITLSAYAIAGWQLTLVNSADTFLSLFFPTPFFTEYNWITFCLEVAPATACLFGTLLFVLETVRNAELTSPKS